MNTNKHTDCSRKVKGDGAKPQGVRGPRTWGKKLVLGSLVSFVFMALLLLLIEGGLFLLGVEPLADHEDPFWGFAAGVPLFVEREANEQIVMETSPKKLSHFNAQEFPKEKTAGTFRIFCLGGSTTYGRPFGDSTSFVGWLREFLPVADPSRAWEVVNAGGISYGSFRVAALMAELAQYEPDLFIVYSGHNEFLERVTYRQELESSEISRWLREGLTRTRIFTLVKGSNAKEAIASNRKIPEENLLDHEVEPILDNTVGPSSYERNDAWKEKVVLAYKENLRTMVEIAKASGAKILFVTPGSNLLDCSPFKPVFFDGLSDKAKADWEALMTLAREEKAADDQERALSLSEQALEIDDREAGALFFKGRMLYKLGRFEEARLALDHAREEDACPLRAISALQRILKEVVEEQDASLLDFASLIEKRSPHGITDKTFFLDHVHLTVEGNRILALDILRELIDRGTLRATENWGAESIAVVSKKVEALIDERARGRSLFNLAKVMSWAGKFEEARRLALRSLEHHEDAEALCLAGSLTRLEGDAQGALDLLKRAMELAPDFARCHREMGLVVKDLALASGDRRRLIEAGIWFEKSLALDPSDANCRGNLANILAMTGRAEESLEHFREAIRLNPNLTELRISFGFVLMRNGKKPEALEQFREALRQDPNNLRAEKFLEEAMEK